MDGDAREQTAAVGHRSRVSVDVDDDKTGRTAGYSHSRPGAVCPPLFNSLHAGGAGMEAVARAPCWQTRTGLGGVVPGLAVMAVGGWGLAARGQRVDRPAVAGAPAGEGKRRHRPGMGSFVARLTVARHVGVLVGSGRKESLVPAAKLLLTEFQTCTAGTEGTVFRNRLYDAVPW